MSYRTSTYGGVGRRNLRSLIDGHWLEEEIEVGDVFRWDVGYCDLANPFHQWIEVQDIFERTFRRKTTIYLWCFITCSLARKRLMTEFTEEEFRRRAWAVER